MSEISFSRSIRCAVAGIAAIAAVMTIAGGAAPAAQAVDVGGAGFATWHETAPATAGGRPEIVESDLGGFLWYADRSSNELVRVDPVSGGQTPYDLGPTHPAVIDMTMTPSGDMWFGDAANAAIDRLDPRTGTVDSFPLGGSFDMAFSVVSGSDGNVWFGEPATGGLGSIAPDGTITRVADPDGAIITNVVSAPDGRLWFTRAGSPVASLGAYDPRSGAFDVVPLALTGLSGLAVAHDGTLWVGGAGALANVTLSGGVSVVPIPPARFGTVTPASLVAGDFAQLYFTDGGGDIGRVELDGSVSFVTPPFAGAMPNRLAVSSIGSLWYTDFNRGTLGSV